MAIKFTPENHTYESIDPSDKTKWVSVTTFINQFKKKFDAVAISEKVSKNKRSKWYGIDPQVIQKIWSAESNRAVDLGNWYHAQREADVMACNTIQRNGIDIPIIKPLVNNGTKIAPDQRLTEGIYPEHFVYLTSAGICGQSDRVEVVNGMVDIIDYKTNKEIKRNGFKQWDGTVEKMDSPLDHLEDCNYNHYALQLSLYMYIILKHNPTLKPGKLELHHITFKEKDEKDAYGNPVLYRDNDGNYIVHNIALYPVPYLKREISNLLKLHDKTI